MSHVSPVLILIIAIGATVLGVIRHVMTDHATTQEVPSTDEA